MLYKCSIVCLVPYEPFPEEMCTQCQWLQCCVVNGCYGKVTLSVLCCEWSLQEHVPTTDDMAENMDDVDDRSGSSQHFLGANLGDVHV